MFSILYFLFSSFATAGTMLHITDIHYDTDYHQGAPNHCYGNMGAGCCHKLDWGQNPYQPAGKWGDYNCDTPFELINETLFWISRNILPDIILYTGDSADHHVLTQSISKNLKTSHIIAKQFDNYFPYTPIYTTYGNHDTYPIDQTIPFVYSHILNDMESYWSKWLNPVTRTLFKKEGYYSQKILPKLDLISFNTIIYDENNLFKTTSQAQFRWLNNTLEASRKAGHKVWFISHIFPGGGESNTFMDIEMHRSLNAYKDIVTATFFGHSHKDQFKLINMSWVAIVSPSLMPSNHDPCFRVFEYDDNTYELLDYTNYCADIKQEKLQYRKTYSFRKEYDVADASFRSWSNLYQKLITNKTLLNKYYTHYLEGYNKGTCIHCEKYLKEIVFTL